MWRKVAMLALELTAVGFVLLLLTPWALQLVYAYVVRLIPWI